MVVPLTDAVGRFTVDGKTQDQKMVAGAPLWIGAEKHAVENVSKMKTDVIVVELKGRK